MAHIQRIDFNHVTNKADGCLCDNCGQWITNIWTVKFKEGPSLHFGIDCFDKHINGKLSKFGKREMKRELKYIKEYSMLLENLKKEEVTEDVQKEWESYLYWQTYWQDHTFEEWKEWMITQVLPNRIEEHEKNLKKFEKINF